ncbi:MAG: hypothetical protein LJF04_05755 [Gemmatimonadetes bacterium]|nr:hypothetical protein [Gemmatimonadota bacterium]
MRRSLAFISLTLILVGLQLATQVGSLVLDRLRAGVGAILAGAEFQISPLRFEAGVCTLLVGLALGVVLLWSSRARADVRAVGYLCPHCGSRTRRVKRRRRHRLLGVVMGESIARRECETCGWVGLSVQG